MNGATAVPFVSTISPPNMTMTMNTGRSQYFLRTRKNAQVAAVRRASGTQLNPLDPEVSGSPR